MKNNETTSVFSYQDDSAEQAFQEKMMDLFIPGVVVAFTPDEAGIAGAFVEDALSEKDASESVIDLIDALNV